MASRALHRLTTLAILGTAAPLACFTPAPDTSSSASASDDDEDNDPAEESSGGEDDGSSGAAAEDSSTTGPLPSSTSSTSATTTSTTSGANTSTSGPDDSTTSTSGDTTTSDDTVTDPSADTTVGSLGCSGTELLCDDFEGYAAGSVPSGGPWHPLDASCEFQLSQFSMEVSTEQANGGNQALKINNKHFAQCRLSGQFDVHDEFWLRAYLYWDPTLDTTDRETLAIDMTPGLRTSDDPAVRFGYRSKAPCTEYAGPQVTIIGIGGGEATGCGSRELPRGQWYCFEAHVTQTGPIEVRTYIDGEAITYQSTGRPLEESVKTSTDVTERIDHVRLGLFSTGEAQGYVFVDDLAIATSRLGCAGG